jgi:hypothetical protein
MDQNLLGKESVKNLHIKAAKYGHKYIQYLKLVSRSPEAKKGTPKKMRKTSTSTDIKIPEDQPVTVSWPGSTFC